MKITFNAPFVLIYTLLALFVLLLGLSTESPLRYHFFSVHAPIGINDPFSILRLVTYTLGHANLAHFTSNFAMILLIGPLVEDYYGTLKLFLMCVVTAIVTGLIHVFFFSSALMGASGIAFMTILLGSLTNSRKGSVPLTFLLVAILYVGNEVSTILRDDNISQLAHILGASIGAAFGFVLQKR